MAFKVFRPTKTDTCDVCEQIINSGFQVTSNCTAGTHHAHLECLNNKAKDVLAGED